jgi:DHA1 family multidrug resistance protein-like MFS transporter
MHEGARSTSVVTRLAIVVFLEWLGATAVLPLLPLYLKTQGASPSTTGLVMASFFLAGVLLQYPAGRLCDRFGRKPVLIGGLTAYAAACLGFLLPTAPFAYGLLRFVQGGAAGAIEVATLATVAIVVPAEQRGRASSRIYSAQLGGAAFGPLLGAFVGVSQMAYIFVLAAVLASVAAIPVLRGDLGPKHVRSEPIGRITLDARLGGAVIVAISLGLVFGVYETCWSLLMHSKGASTFQLGLSWMFFALPYVFFVRAGGWLADHTDRRVTSTIGIVNNCVFCVIYPLLASVNALLALCCFEAIGSSLALPSAQSILTEGANPLEVGRRQGFFATAQTASMGVAAAVSGAMFQVSPKFPFLAMAMVAVVVASFAPIVWRRVPGRVAPAAVPGTASV